jgi:spore germination cell wall hydrolase CwlJ-like protein
MIHRYQAAAWLVHVTPGPDQLCPQVKQMHRNDTTPRCDRIMLIALAIVLATISATLGAAMPHRAAPPPVAAKIVPAAPQEIEDTALSQLVAEHRCLTEALYYEARGEGRIGEQAVAEVVFHRLRTGTHGQSICAVVYEGSFRRGCQFSFTCDGALHRPHEATAWARSGQLAAQILTGAVRLRNATGGATNYHALQVSPVWAPTLKITARIGNHIFYRAVRES